MSTDTHKWIGSYPQISKKKMMGLNSCGKQHISSKSVQEVYGDREKKSLADIFTIASVMSLWQNSDAQQAPCQAPQQNRIQRGACKDTMRFRTITGTQLSSVFNSNAPLYFQDQQRYRSKVTSLCVSSRQTFNLLKPTTCIENPIEGRINNLGISKDFGNDFCIILKDDTIKTSSFCGHLQRNCVLQTREFGECETVQTSMKKRYKNSELKSSSLIVLGILPLLSSVIELKNVTELLVSQVHVFKKLISYAILFRLCLLRAVLKKCEYLRVKGHFKVNKTESNEKNLNLNVSSVSVVNQVLSDMALNQQMYPVGWRMDDGEDDEFPREEDEGQDDMNYREVPGFYQQELGGNGDDAEFWSDRFREEQPVEVLGGVAGGPAPIFHEPGQLQDEFANDIIDHDFMAAICDHVNAPDLPMEEDVEDEQLVIGENMFVDLLGHHEAAEAA